MSEMKYQKEFEEFVRKNPEFLGGNTLTVQRENYGASLDTPEYAASYVRFSYEMFCKIKEQLEQELVKLKEENEKLRKLIWSAIALKLLHQPLTAYGSDWTRRAKQIIGE